MSYPVYVVLTNAADELHRGQSYEGAKQVADNWKRNAGKEARIELRDLVYSTRTMAERTADQKAARQ